MARPPRIQYEGACYHVYHRGNRRERIYWDDADYAKFEEFMIEAMNWSGVRLFDWSLMPNHFHLLLDTPDGNLAEFMQRLATRYAKYFNWIHKKVGHVFQGRYGSRLCDKEQYFMELVRYVELNPYRLKKGSLAKLGEWKWSSLRYYMGKEEPPEGLRQAMQEVLGRFGNSIPDARKNLAKYLAEGLKEGHWEDFYRKRGGRILGEEAFIERVKGGANEPVRQQKRRLMALTGASELRTRTESCFGMSTEDLCHPGKDRRRSRVRQALVEVGRKYYRFPVKELAKLLMRSEPAISRMLRRCWEKGSELQETRQLRAFLEDQISKPSETVVESPKC